MAQLPQTKKGYLKGVKGAVIERLNLDGTIPTTPERHGIKTTQNIGIESKIVEGETSELRGGDAVLVSVEETDVITGAELKLTDARFDAKATELIAGGTLIEEVDGEDTRIIGWSSPTIEEQKERIPIMVEIYVQAYDSYGSREAYIKYVFYFGIGYAPTVNHEDNAWSTPEFTIKCKENSGQAKSTYEKFFVDSLPVELQ